MSNKKYIYFVEGPCEEKLIDVLKQQPSLLCPGKIKVINVLQEVLSVKSHKKLHSKMKTKQKARQNTSLFVYHKIAPLMNCRVSDRTKA